MSRREKRRGLTNRGPVGVMLTGPFSCPVRAPRASPVTRVFERTGGWCGCVRGLAPTALTSCDCVNGWGAVGVMLTGLLFCAGRV